MCGAKADAKTRTNDAETALSILSNARNVTYSKCQEYKRLTDMIRFLRPVPTFRKYSFECFVNSLLFIVRFGGRVEYRERVFGRLLLVT